jgi:hypothetical protein
MTEVSLEAAAPRRSGKSRDLPRGYRLEVFSRSLFAIVGGFVATSAICIALALALSNSGLMPRASATSLTTLISWIIWTCLAMWAFYERRLWRLALQLGVLTAASAAIILVLL